MAATTNPSGRRKGGHVGKTILKGIGTLFLVGVVTCAFLACFAAVYITTEILPNAHVEAQAYSTALASTIYYTDQETGQPVELQSLYGTENRVWITYDEIPKNLVNATIAIEDRRFYEHHGVDWLRTGRAVLSMMTGDDIQGGSTLTQQLLKNMTQYKDVTVKRKILEIFRALDFEKNHTKDEIMELYLNYIYLGQKCYGVSTAAEYYFGKDVRELTLAECASLISITNNPSVYNPYRYPENNAFRATLVLQAMLEQGKISQAEYDEAAAQVKAGLNFTQGQGDQENSTANVLSWYAEQVVRDVIADLTEQYEFTNEVASNMVYSGGLKIYACIDPAVQAVVDEVYLNRENLPQVSSRGEQIQSAAVVIDHDGNVVAIAGSMGEKTANQVLNMATMSKRQPGSSLKPLSAYAPAIDLGIITPNSVFDDTPVMELGGSAWPSNSYGYYWGRELVSKAVEQSSNPIPARVIQEMGISQSMDYLQNHFHIDTIVTSGEDGKSNDEGLAQLALGGLTRGVTVMDMAGAYSVFPRNGVYVEPRTYTKVTREQDGQEYVLLDKTGGEQESAVKATTAWYVNSMLKQVIKSPNGIGTGTEARFSGMTIAGKTGSTNDYRDRWFVGYSPYYTAAVWTGYADHPESIRPGSKNPAAQMWRKIMEPIHNGLENKDFDQPDGLVTVNICLDSGELAGPNCPLDPRGGRVQGALFFNGDQPTGYCDVHTETVEVCTAGQAAEGEEAPLYLAGEFCPREGNAAGETPTVKTVSLPSFARENFGKSARDDAYRMEHLKNLGTCAVHTEPAEKPTEYDPSTFNPEDPSTYPPSDLYPDFDPFDPTTWPAVGPEPGPTDDPVPPGESEYPQPTETPAVPTQSPSEEVAPPPEAQ